MRTCQAPEHHGDRRIEHPYDAWERRTTYRRVDGKVRRHEKTLEIVCTQCMERLESTVNESQGALVL